jgi:tetratricopeptide (TPR) repeat protein
MIFPIFRKRVTTEPQGPTRAELLEKARTQISQGHLGAGEVYLDELGERYPGDAEICNETGVLRYLRGDFTGAEQAFGEAAALAPRDPKVRANLGQSLQARGLFAESIAHFEAALALDPLHETTRFNLAVATYALGDRRRAADLLASLVAAHTDDATMHLALGECLLSYEEFAAGWREYEWRLKVPEYAKAFRNFSKPQWDEASRPEGAVLVWCEQGYGDALQFMRLLAELATRLAPKEVIFDAPASLYTLVRHSFAAWSNLHVLEPGQAYPAFSHHVSLMSLPALLGARLTENRAPMPYLQVPPEVARRWAERVPEADARKPRVGLVWAGNKREALSAAEQAVDVRRSAGAEVFARIIDGMECDFFNLQVGARTHDMAALGHDLHDHTAVLADFAESAGLMSRLDLIVTVDTSVAHLAGGLGRPVWMLSRFDCCWRWGERRASIPWYPTMRPFYQPAPGAWDGVVDEVRAALLEFTRKGLAGA